MTALALALSALIGISLGLLGGGGSILAVPVLRYVAGFEVEQAIALSLLTVGTTSVVGAARHWQIGNIELRAGLLFGAVSMSFAFAAGYAAAYVSDTLQMGLFAVVMAVAAVAMLRKKPQEAQRERRWSAPRIVLAGAGVGLLTGIVGVGGGFLIVPALVAFAAIPMKRSVGTSLLVIAMNSAAGFAGYAARIDVPVGFTLAFIAIAVAGVFGGAALVRITPERALRRGFAVFLLVVAAGILSAGL